MHDREIPQDNTLASTSRWDDATLRGLLEVDPPVPTLVIPEDAWRPSGGRGVTTGGDGYASHADCDPLNAVAGAVAPVSDTCWICGDPLDAVDEHTELRAMVSVCGTLMHALAIEVRPNDDGDLQAPMCGDDDTFEQIHGALHSEGPWETTTIAGREYVIIITPQS